MTDIRSRRFNNTSLSNCTFRAGEWNPTNETTADGRNERNVSIDVRFLGPAARMIFDLTRTRACEVRYLLHARDRSTRARIICDQYDMIICTCAVSLVPAFLHVSIRLCETNYIKRVQPIRPCNSVV